MSLSDYIKGDRYGKEAHQLEYDAMRDPFLQDAIDGYDSEGDRPTYHLKKLTNEVKKRTRKKYYRLQAWGIAACALLIIGASIFFFYGNDNKINLLPEKSTYAETDTDNMQARNPMIDSLATAKTEQTTSAATANSDAIVIDKVIVHDDDKAEAENIQEDLLATIEKLKIRQENQQEIRGETEEDQRIALNQEDNSNEYSLTNSEIQRILSEYNPSVETNSKVTNNQSPKPAVGDQAYNDYIKKNLKPLTNNAGEEQHGKVVLSFSVNENGRPANISVLQSLGQAADREAIRLLQNGPNWTTSDKNASLEINF
ncbi:MAG: TonB family protein [Candidatus Azobacteroides sp.]|nr:TonB family protein [Candidatus Azobacteroides sp.]